MADDRATVLRLRAYGEVIRMYRERADLSQLDLAKRLGYLPRMVRAIESGQRDPHRTSPDADPYERMAGALGVSEEEIATATRERYRQLSAGDSGRRGL